MIKWRGLKTKKFNSHMIRLDHVQAIQYYYMEMNKYNTLKWYMFSIFLKLSYQNKNIIGSFQTSKKMTTKPTSISIIDPWKIHNKGCCIYIGSLMLKWRLNACNLLKNTTKEQNKEKDKSPRWTNDSFLLFVILNSKNSKRHVKTK